MFITGLFYVVQKIECTVNFLTHQAVQKWDQKCTKKQTLSKRETNSWLKKVLEDHQHFLLKCE